MGPNRFVVLVAAIAAAGCSAASTSTPATPSPTPKTAATPTSAPSPAIATVTLVRLVSGPICGISIVKDETVGQTDVMVEHFNCPGAVMSDPRLSGTLVMDLTTTFDPASAPTASWVGPMTITNDAGTWTGQGRGAVVMWPDLNGAPHNYGEATYEGTGAYQGLVYHELISGGDTQAMTSGWIEAAP